MDLLPQMPRPRPDIGLYPEKLCLDTFTFNSTSVYQVYILYTDIKHVKDVLSNSVHFSNTEMFLSSFGFENIIIWHDKVIF